MGNQQTIAKVMEGRTRNRSISTNSSRNPLSDCTNTIDALNSSQSSSTPSQNSSSSVKPGRFLTKKTDNTCASTKSSESQANNENSPSNPSAVFVPCSTTPPRTAKASSLEDTATHKTSELASVYNRRRSGNTRKGKRKEVAEPMSCFPAAKTGVTRDEMNEGDSTRLTKSCTLPHKKKRRQTTPKEDLDKNALPQDFIEQQRAYFAEIDAFDLEEEEVASINELD